MPNQTMLRAVLAATVGTAMLLAAASAAQAQSAWLTNVKAAQAEAKRSNRVILANFTGSDWCPFCVKLKGEVFDTPVFAKWAATNAVLLEVDFPRKAQVASLKAQNKQLAEAYGITGYPTVVFLDADGKELGRYGYAQGGAEKWIKVADGILVNRPKPEELKVSTNLTESVTAAKDQSKPLLLLISDPKKAESAKALETMLTVQDFVKLANRRLVAVTLKMPVDPDSADGKALAAWYEGLKLPRGPVVALIDVAENKLLYQTTTSPKAEIVLPAIRKALPTMKYDGSWLEDFETAQALAIQLKRPMLLDFTGSDWCGWCMKLEAEVFSTEAFKKAAADGLILVKIDFPKTKKLPADQQQRNQALATKFSVSGYPTIIVLNSAGVKLGDLGYMAGGPDVFLAALKKILTPKA